MGKKKDATGNGKPLPDAGEDDSPATPTDVVVLSASVDHEDGPMTVDGPERKGLFKRRKGAGQPVLEETEQAADGKKGKTEEVDKGEPATFRDLFVFADKYDWMLMVLGGVMAGLAGASFPLMGVLMGDVLDAFYPVYVEDEVAKTSLKFFGLAVAMFITTYLGCMTFGWSAARQVRQIRAQSLRHSLMQEMGWFDTTKPNELASRIAGDTVVIEQGIGQKLSDLIKFTCQFLSGFIIGFTRGWKLTLTMMASLPLLAGAFMALGLFMRKSMVATQKNYAKAGGVAEETFSSIRTVAALRAENTLTAKFHKLVLEAEKYGLQGGFATAAAVGSVFCFIFLSYALGWWMGGWLIAHGDSQVRTVGDVTNVFFSVMMGSMALAQVGPNLTAILEARGAIQSILQVLRRVPLIGADLEAGIEPSGIEGNVAFRNVHFTYPARKEAPILKGFNLEIKRGQTVALVGPSGSGKSTCIQLLQRFYDPDSGSVELDGVDLRDLKLRWLREQMGLVSQEPVLFQGTIAENIAWGAGGLGKVTMEEIIEAAKKANAHRFIMQFPDGYETVCGEKGAMLSGGQKQRVAIARAIVRRPNIVLLDEATSALDTESERIVQEALDELMHDKHCTCIVVAHRLSTIRNADLIVAFDNGTVAEQGTHEELIARDGVYASLVRIQMSASAHDEERKREQESRDVQAYEQMMLEELIRKSSTRATSSKRISQKNAGMMTSRESVASAHSLPSRSPVVEHTNKMLTGLGLKDSETESGDEETGEATKLKGWALHKRVFALNKPVRGIYILAVSCAVITGCVFPVNAIMVTEMMKTLGKLAFEPSKMYDEVCKYAIGYLGFALAAGFFTAAQISCYRYIGEKITTDLRVSSFANTVRQDIAFFDAEENNTGALTARLATDAPLVKAVAGENQGRQVQNMATLTAGLLIAFIMGSWRVTLVLLSLLPLLVGVSMFQMRFVGFGAQKSQQSVAESGKLATESISNVRTVKAYGLEQSVFDRYFTALSVSTKEGIRKGNLGGLASGATMFITFGGYALVFWYGGHLVGSGEITFDQCMKSLMAIMMAAMGLAQQSAFMSDTTAALDAARKIFSVEDRRPIIDSSSNSGEKHSTSSGLIEVQSVVFKYPSRPNQTVLDGYSLKIQPGQTVALVGESGSGKSTIISLLERYYDPLQGKVLLDGRDLKNLNIGWLRDQIGLVGQEPVLFGGTIADNIRMGKSDATLDDVIEAAKMANAHSFIMAFPNAYDTEVGERGVQLSGGQKQRIAIARAIIKNPPILLLDEATSALDAESERVVQEALDRLLAIKRRTTLVVAHRLSTIQNADLIAVHKAGKVVELGTHEQLLKQGGEYAMLNKTQVRL